MKKPFFYYLAGDAFSLLFTYVPTVLIWGAGFIYFNYMWRMEQWWALALTPFVACFALFLIVLIVRMVLPKLKPGSYPLTPNPMMMSWWAQVQLARLPATTSLRFFIFSSNLLRFLYMRAAGAKVDYRSSASMECDFLDYALITIGKDGIFGDGSAISCHMVVKDRLLLKPVRIGERVFVSARCAIGPGTILEDDSYLGYGNAIYGMTVKQGEKVPDFVYSEGPKRKKESSSDPSAHEQKRD